MSKKRKILSLILVAVLIVSAFAVSIFAELGVMTADTGFTPTATEAVATNSELMASTALDRQDNLFKSARRSAQFASISASAMNAYYVTPTQTGDPYIDIRIENAGADTASHAFIGWNESSKTKYAAGTYFVADFDIYSDWQYISEMYFGVISRTSASKPTGGTAIYFNTLGLTAGKWNHVTFMASVDTGILHVYVNNTLVKTVEDGLWNNVADGTQYFESMRLQVNFAKSGTKVVDGQNTVIDNMSVRLNYTDNEIASIFGANDIQSWSSNVYGSNYEFNTIPELVRVDGVAYTSAKAAMTVIETGNEAKNVEFLRPYASPFVINGDCTVNTNGLNVNLIAKSGVGVIENADGTITYNAPLKSEITITPTATATDFTNATKLNNAGNILTKLSGTGVSASIENGTAGTYVIKQNFSGKDYLVSINRGITSSSSVYYSLQVMKVLTYNANTPQYIVYDFDFATLSGSDEATGAVFNSITRSQDNKTAYFTSGFNLKNYWQSTGYGEAKHLTVVYDFNNNKSYLFCNNTLLASLNNGCMSAAGFTAFKAGNGINHNEFRIMRPYVDFAIDNVSARYVVSDSSLASALSAGSLSGWSGNLYTSDYDMMTVAHRATVDGAKIYSEKHLAEVLADGDDSKNVELLLPLSKALYVGCPAVINTNGYNVELTLPDNAKTSAQGDVITVTHITGKISTVAMSALYQNGMVFQRGEEINVSGYCDTESSVIKVNLAGAEKTATVKDGKWSVTFDAMTAAKGLTLTVEELDTLVPVTLTYTDVAIGEVWVLSGQSNINYYIYDMEDFEEYRLNADNFDNIRAFVVNNVYANGENDIGAGEWLTPNSTNLKTTQLSAIGYVMATKLSTELGSDVTVAIVDATYPGSIVKSWIDSDVYAKTFGENHADMVTYRAYKDYYETYGTHPSSTSDLPEYIGKGYQQVVGSCYDAMMHFMSGYNAKGVVWYQGCGDRSRYSTYQTMFNAVAETFRRDFGDENLPIYLIQLAPYGADASEIRAVQYDIAKDDDNVYLVSANTEGTVFTASDLKNSSVSDYFVHASRKSPIGKRLADSILKNTYSIAEGVVTAPVILSVTANAGVLTVTFDTDLSLLFGNSPEGFEIAGSDGVYYKANAVIKGNAIELTSANVSAPASVRYGFGTNVMLVLDDGTRVIPANGFSGSASDTEKATIKDVNGNTYVFYADEYDVIFSTLSGNITNESGHPLPVFKLSVGYTNP